MTSEPIQIVDPVERIQELSACMDEIKASLGKHGITAAIVAIAIQKSDGNSEMGEAAFGPFATVVQLLAEIVGHIEKGTGTFSR